jgi:hypothetical protein
VRRRATGTAEPAEVEVELRRLLRQKANGHAVRVPAWVWVGVWGEVERDPHLRRLLRRLLGTEVFPSRWTTTGDHADRAYVVERPLTAAEQAWRDEELGDLG